MRSDLVFYRDITTGTVYVVASYCRQGVTLRDLESEPGDASGLLVVSEWDLWQALQSGRWQRCI